MSAAIEEHSVDVGGMSTRCFAAGADPPLALLHGDGESALDWTWTLPALARSRRWPELRPAAKGAAVAGTALGALVLLRARS